MSTSMGTPINGVAGRGFGMTGGGGARGNLAMDNGRGWAEMVLSDTEGVRGVTQSHYSIVK